MVVSIGALKMAVSPSRSVVVPPPARANTQVVQPYTKPNRPTITVKLNLGGSSASAPSQPSQSPRTNAPPRPRVAPSTPDRITDSSRLLPGPERPTPRQSELDVAKDFPSWGEQQSFKDGLPARYGLEGSVRPDLSHPTLPIHLDVKNYDLSSSANRYNLYRTLATQSAERAKGLPSGSIQGVVLDIRGQCIDPAVLQRIPTNIQQVTNGRIKAQDVIFKRN